MALEHAPSISVLDRHYAGSLAVLRMNQMLSTLGDDEIPTLLTAGQWVVFEQDEVVSRQGTGVRDVLFIVEGRGKAEVSAPVNANFVAVLNLLKPGDDIGLLSLVDGAPHSATVIALERIFALSIPTTDLRNMLKAHVEWYRLLAKVAVWRLRHSSVWLQALM